MGLAMAVREAVAADMDAIQALVVELAVFERAPDAVHTDAAGLRASFELGRFRAFVACVDEAVVGFALFFPHYSTWDGASTYLEDLYVRPAHRRGGLGRALFDAVAREAARLGSARLMWQVLDWNADARAFYARVHAHTSTEWLNCRLTRTELQRYYAPE